MKPGQIIEQGYFGENWVKFRYPVLSDATGAMKTINSLIKERANIAAEKRVTLEREKRWIRGWINDIKEKTGVLIVADIDEYFGSCEIRKSGHGPYRHVGNLGIAIRKDIRGSGIGKRLMEIAIEEAKENLSIEIVRLDVYSNNKKAIKLYESLGFKKQCQIKKGAIHFNKYRDVIIMVKYL